jgi:HPt (histidine-containing phosphotransfer) domain-containing protein
MDEFLEKPLRLPTLARLLHLHLRRSQESMPADTGDGATDATTAPLELLQADIGVEMTLELVREYLAGAERAIEALSRPNPVDARVTAHRLLGGARVLGLPQFERIWATLSDCRDGAELNVTSATLAELRNAAAELTAWIDSHQRKQHV